MKTLPLVLIAGWGHTGETMLPLKEALTGYAVQVTSTDELWQSQVSGALPGASGLSRYAMGLHNRLAPFGGRVGVIGWSMGGIVALETVRQYPGMFQRLAVISGTARFCAGNDELPGVSGPVLRAMVMGLRRMPHNVLDAYFDNVHAPQSDPDVALRNPAIARLDHGELLQGLDYLQRIDVRSGLAKQTVPTLVVHGRNDRIVPWQAGEWLSRALPTSRWRCYEGLGHALPIQAPSRLAEDICAFLGDAT